MKKDFIRVARATRTQGLRGEFRIDLILDDNRVLESGRTLQMSVQGNERAVVVESFRRQHGRFVLKLAGIDSIEDAEKIIGGEFRIEAAELPEPEAGAFYTFHLRGCRVYAGTNDYIGDVIDVIEGGGTQLLQVGEGKEETLIPFADSIVKSVDLAGRRIEVELPEGLRELNK